jgi:glycogen(starch) synthase
MRVLLVGDFPPPYGGISVHVQQLRSLLVEQGHAVRVLDIGKGKEGAPVQERASVQGKGGTELGTVHPERSAAKSRDVTESSNVLKVRSPMALLKELVAAVKDGWTIHLHTSGNNPKSWALISLVAGVGSLGRTRPIVTVHSGLAPTFLATSSAARTMGRIALKAYGAIVAVSPAVREALTGLGVTADQMIVAPAFLPSQVRPGTLPEAMEDARGRFSPLLCMAHHPSKVYGRDTMFHALRLARARWPRVGVALFGPGTDSDEFREAVRAADVANQLCLLGEVTHPEALAVMQRCDAFVRPTTADGDAISVREALALGIRCVASDAASRPHGTHVFKTGQAEDLVDVLERALAQPAIPYGSNDFVEPLLNLYRQTQESNHEAVELGFERT